MFDGRVSEWFPSQVEKHTSQSTSPQPNNQSTSPQTPNTSKLKITANRSASPGNGQASQNRPKPKVQKHPPDRNPEEKIENEWPNPP